MRVALESPDQPDVLQLIDELDAYQDTLYPPESRHALDLASLKQPRVLFAVARAADGAAIGCAAVVLDLPHGELKRMYVRPAFRGRGYGKRMLDHLAGYACQHGVSLLRLETGIYQREAIGLYEGMGFQRIPAFPPYQEDPLSRCYEKKLGLE